MIATPIAVRAQARHGVRALWRVVCIISLCGSKNNCLRNHVIYYVDVAEMLGFGTVVSGGFSEPPSFQVLVGGIVGLIGK